MNLCLLTGAKASNKVAIGLAFEESLVEETEDLVAGGGKAVKVCEVDVMEDVVLPVFAMIFAVAVSLVHP